MPLRRRHRRDKWTVRLHGKITPLNFNLGAMNDTFDNQTADRAIIDGGVGTDTIINSGDGNDLLSLKGSEDDQVDSCGAGNDKADLDHRDVLRTTGCETVFIDGVQILPVPAPPGPTPPRPRSR